MGSIMGSIVVYTAAVVPGTPVHTSQWHCLVRASLAACAQSEHSSNELFPKERGAMKSMGTL